MTNSDALQLPWLFLAFGLFFATVGTYYATPAAVQAVPSYIDHYVDDEEDIQEDSSRISQCFQRLKNTTNPFVLLLIPISFAIAVIIPATLSNRIWDKALDLEKQWQIDYSNMTVFTQEMIQQSQVIWYTQLKASKITAIVVIIYTILSISMGFTYAIIAFRLIRTVHQDLIRSRRHQDDVKNEQGDLARNAVQNRMIQDHSECKRDQEISTTSTSTQVTSQDADVSTTGRENAAISTADENTRHETVKLLESALLHICLQAFAIMTGVISIGALSFSFALLFYGKLEQPSSNGGNLFEDHIGKIWEALMYCSCFSGGVSIFAVAYKTYEPVITSNKGSHINFSDLIKGLPHIQSTFFRSTMHDGDDHPRGVSADEAELQTYTEKHSDYSVDSSISASPPSCSYKQLH